MVVFRFPEDGVHRYGLPTLSEQAEIVMVHGKSTSLHPLKNFASTHALADKFILAWTGQNKSRIIMR